MGRVEDSDVEDLEGSGLTGEGFDVMAEGSESLSQSPGGSEAVGEIDLAFLALCLSLETLVVHASYETEPVGAGVGGIEDHTVDVNSDSLFHPVVVGPGHALRLELALVEQISKAIAVDLLQVVLLSVDAFQGPGGLDSGFSALLKTNSHALMLPVALDLPP